MYTLFYMIGDKHLTPHMLHLICCTLYAAPYMLHLICCTLYSGVYLLHLLWVSLLYSHNAKSLHLSIVTKGVTLIMNHCWVNT